MASTRITFELPEDLFASLDAPHDLENRAFRALVLDLLSDAEISQGRAAQLLGMTRLDLLRLLAEHHILSGPETAEEAERDVEAAQMGVFSAVRDVGG